MTHSNAIHTAALIAVMSLGTAVLRFAPFLVFRRRVPAYVVYLGKVLPAAIIGMLVIYCLKDVSVQAPPFGMPELVSVAAVVVLQRWKRSSLLSILGGTLLYMVLIRVF